MISEQGGTAATALLFERERVEEVEDWTGRLGNLGRSAFLGIDLRPPDDPQVRDLADSLGLVRAGGYRTNEIMKVLTLASVLLLERALVAGVLGMSFEVGAFDHGGPIWVVVALIVATAAGTMAVARRQRDLGKLSP